MSDPARYNPQPPRPAWGIRPPPKKNVSTALPILTAPSPAQVVIPIRQSLGMPARAIVTPGQRVRTGEPIAESIAQSATGAGPKLHASISGYIHAI